MISTICRIYFINENVVHVHVRIVVTLQSLTRGGVTQASLTYLCYHLKEVRIVALPFYLYNIGLEEYVK